MADTGRRMTRARLSKPDVSSFPQPLYLIGLMDHGGTGAAGWLSGVSGFSRRQGNEWRMLGWQRGLISGIGIHLWNVIFEVVRSA